MTSGNRKDYCIWLLQVIATPNSITLDRSEHFYVHYIYSHHFSHFLCSLHLFTPLLSLSCSLHLFTPLLSLSCSLHLFTPLLSFLFSFYLLFIIHCYWPFAWIYLPSPPQNGSQSLSRFLFVSTNILYFFPFFSKVTMSKSCNGSPMFLPWFTQGPCGQRIWGLIKTHFLCCRKVEVGGWNIALWITFTWYRKMICPATKKSGCLKMPPFQKITNRSLVRNPM